MEMFFIGIMCLKTAMRFYLIIHHFAFLMWILTEKKNWSLHINWAVHAQTILIKYTKYMVMTM